jgi:hypothetical protein
MVGWRQRSFEVSDCRRGRGRLELEDRFAQEGDRKESHDEKVTGKAVAAKKVKAVTKAEPAKKAAVRKTAAKEAVARKAPAKRTPQNQAAAAPTSDSASAPVAG